MQILDIVLCIYLIPRKYLLREYFPATFDILFSFKFCIKSKINLISHLSINDDNIPTRNLFHATFL